MSEKKKKYNPNKKYKFDVEKGEYIEKQKYVEAKENPVAIIYVRVSDQKQVDEGNGLESQENTSRRWAENKGIVIEKVFTDSAISGTRLDRKGLHEAIDYLKKQNHKYPRITYFLCTEVSRISRSEDIAQSIEMKRVIEATGVSIYTTQTGRNISSENISDSFMTDFEFIRAKHESLQIRERSMNGAKSKLYNGHWIFHPPVGYERIYVKAGNKTEKLLQMVEPQASIIKEGLELFANGTFINNMQLLHYFNDKKLQSNYHNPNPGKLGLTFIQRLFELERLYFYAGFILYPNYGVTKPIEAVHRPLITLSTVNKILKRIDSKGGLKFGPRKDSSDIYPLRGLVSCPHCNYPMTGRPSKGKMGKIYHYYGCNRKDCKEKENINVDAMHDDFKKLLGSITPKKGVISLLDLALKETIKEKNKVLLAMVDSKKRRIIEIDKELESYSMTISKLTKVELIRKLEEKRAELESEKEILQNEINDKLLSETDFIILFDRIKNIIEDPLSIWDLGTIELKILLVGVLFGGKIYYKKNEGYQTPQISALYSIFDHFESGTIPSGAGDGTRTRNSLLGRQAL